MGGCSSAVEHACYSKCSRCYSKPCKDTWGGDRSHSGEILCLRCVVKCTYSWL
ncbi:Protein of unknown function, partial [Gryllus bimaculatus]